MQNFESTMHRRSFMSAAFGVVVFPEEVLRLFERRRVQVAVPSNYGWDDHEVHVHEHRLVVDRLLREAYVPQM